MRTQQSRSLTYEQLRNKLNADAESLHVLELARLVASDPEHPLLDTRERSDPADANAHARADGDASSKCCIDMSRDERVDDLLNRWCKRATTQTDASASATDTSPSATQADASASATDASPSASTTDASASATHAAISNFVCGSSSQSEVDLTQAKWQLSVLCAATCVPCMCDAYVCTILYGIVMYAYAYVHSVYLWCQLSGTKQAHIESPSLRRFCLCRFSSDDYATRERREC